MVPPSCLEGTMFHMARKRLLTRATQINEYVIYRKEAT